MSVDSDGEYEAWCFLHSEMRVGPRKDWVHLQGRRVCPECVAEISQTDDSGWLDDDEMVGEVVHREVVTEVEIERVHSRKNGLHVQADRRSTRGDILNLGTSAAGLSDGSKLHLGGDRYKRVTHTDTVDGTYIYVEIGERDGDV